MIILGVDPGSLRTGYGAIETDGRRHRLVGEGRPHALPPRSLARPAGVRSTPASPPSSLACGPTPLAVEDVLPRRQHPDRPRPRSRARRGAPGGAAGRPPVPRLLAGHGEGPGHRFWAGGEDAGRDDGLAAPGPLRGDGARRRRRRLGGRALPRPPLAPPPGSGARRDRAPPGPAPAQEPPGGGGRRPRRRATACHSRLHLLPPRPTRGRSSTLRIHTHVREDTLALFGFLTAGEQDLFERLIDVSGVGPEAGPQHPLRHRGPRPRRGPPQRRRRPPHPGARSGQEDGRAARAGAEGQDAARPRRPGDGRPPCRPAARRRTFSPPSPTSATRGPEAERGRRPSPARGRRRAASRTCCVARCATSPAAEAFP